MLGFSSCVDIGGWIKQPAMYGTPHADFSIKGKVTDEAGKPVQSATLIVRDLGYKGQRRDDESLYTTEYYNSVLTTDSEGNYSITRESSGGETHFRIVAKDAAHEADSVEVTMVPPGGKNVVSVKLTANEAGQGYMYGSVFEADWLQKHSESEAIDWLTAIENMGETTVGEWSPYLRHPMAPGEKMLFAATALFKEDGKKSSRLNWMILEAPKAVGEKVRVVDSASEVNAAEVATDEQKLRKKDELVKYYNGMMRYFNVSTVEEFIAKEGDWCELYKGTLNAAYENGEYALAVVALKFPGDFKTAEANSDFIVIPFPAK